MNKRTLIIDSSQISSFLECPQLWAYSYLSNITPFEQKPNDKMMKGVYGHKLLEIYYKARVQGTTLAEAVQLAIKHDFDSETNCCCGHSPKSHSAIALNNKQLKICQLCSGTEKYFHSFEPAPFPLSAPLRLSVQEIFRKYALLYGSQPDVIPHSEKAVEVGFSETIYEDSEHLFVLEGKIDLLGTLNNQDIIVDHKFQESAHELYKKAVQFRNYSMITNVKLMIINYIRMGKNPFKQFDRRLISFSQAEHSWWRGELIKIYFSMLKFTDSINEYGTVTKEGGHNWSSCTGKYFSECPYTQLCEERDAEQVKLVKINQNFTKRESWRPWTASSEL